MIKKLRIILYRIDYLYDIDDDLHEVLFISSK